MIEEGRHIQVDRKYKFCPFCLERNVYSIEDEFHFLWYVLSMKNLEIYTFIQTGDEILYCRIFKAS